MSVITEQTVHTVCGYLLILILFKCHTSDHHFLLEMQVHWRTRLRGRVGDHTPLLLFLKVRCQVGIPEIRFCFILQNTSECQHCHMSALSKSRRGVCFNYLDFLINTGLSLFPWEDIRNDLHVIWFETETRGILVEEGFWLITS